MMPPGFPGAPGAAAAGAGAQGGEGGSRSAEEAAAAAMADPSAYADAMSGVFANPQFLEMAEKLGQQLMQVGVVQHRRCRCGHLDAADQSILVEQHLLPGSGTWPDPSACNGTCCCAYFALPVAAAQVWPARSSRTDAVLPVPLAQVSTICCLHILALFSSLFLCLQEAAMAT